MIDGRDLFTSAGVADDDLEFLLPNADISVELSSDFSYALIFRVKSEVIRLYRNPNCENSHIFEIPTSSIPYSYSVVTQSRHASDIDAWSGRNKTRKGMFDMFHSLDIESQFFVCCQSDKYSYMIFSISYSS